MFRRDALPRCCTLRAGDRGTAGIHLWHSERSRRRCDRRAVGGVPVLSREDAIVEGERRMAALTLAHDERARTFRCNVESPVVAVGGQEDLIAAAVDHLREGWVEVYDTGPVDELSAPEVFHRLHCGFRDEHAADCALLRFHEFARRADHGYVARVVDAEHGGAARIGAD